MKISRSILFLFSIPCIFLSLSVTSPAAETWKAGVSRTIITPTEQMWMAGFAARTNPATGKLTELWAKALALEDASGHRAVIVTSDLLGIPQNIYQHVTAAVANKYQLQPDQIILSASHTHCGPVLRDALYDIYPLDEVQRNLIENYSAHLEQQLVEIIGKALADLTTARIAAGQGTTAFAVNRRNNREPEVAQLINAGTLKGPVDHAVPVLAVYLPDGTLKAILCGYACHNTSLAGNDWCGDYAGFAQIALEKSHPGAQAMFFMGCGGDQNPLPRRELHLGERYGNMLAAAVEEVLLAPPHKLAPELATKMKMLSLHLGAPLTIPDLQTLTNDSALPTRQWAARWLQFLQAGKSLPRDYSYPLQAWKLGGEQLLITLGGEPVVDYANKFKQAFGSQTWVAGYCNDVMTYIPSLRVLKEDAEIKPGERWGYEGSYCFVVYGLPAKRWAEDVEELITKGGRELVSELKTK